ncbi:hypothetical protein ARAF_0521 [Arsenophonus endosymbiont of Aleurodicus floccissimus]|nr:hypothetical protein ARAF_0521 [Arsenophonus endosymbiont of Aleurodicus floccissimus]
MMAARPRKNNVSIPNLYPLYSYTVVNRTRFIGVIVIHNNREVSCSW